MRREGAPSKPEEPEKARWGWGSDKLWWMKEVVELTWAKKFGKTRGMVGEDDDGGGDSPANGKGKSSQRHRNERNQEAAMEDIREARRWAGDRVDETDSDLEEKKVTQRTEGEDKDSRRVGKGTKAGEREQRDGKEASEKEKRN